MLYNRDLSWLGFNYRVLQEANDEQVPLYERLRFLSIFSSNLDEFFRVRYPVVAAFSKLSDKTIRKGSFLNEDDVAEKIQAQISEQLNEFGSILNDQLLPALENNNVVFYYNKTILPQHTIEIRQLFLAEVLSFIQPVFLNGKKDNDFVPENGRLYFIVSVADESSEFLSQVCVNIPAHKLKRFFTLSPIDGKQYVILIDDVVRENISMLFPGKQIKGIYSIKLNRNAEINLNDDLTSDVLEKIEKQINKRELGATSRFLFENNMPLNLQLFLAVIFKVGLKDMFAGGRYHNLSDLFNFPNFDKALYYPKAVALQHPPITSGDIFANITQKDVLIHMPYHSYAPVLSFFNQAAVDADVTDIFITLYRVATESHIVNALISAAKNGKNVIAFIELKARFDEANNIKWSRVMKNAGVKLIYSDPAIKVHSKIALVKKVKSGVAQNFGVVSTGNFNESTATFYTDHVLLTANNNVCTELENLFGYLKQKKGEQAKMKLHFDELFVSQFNLLPDFEALIDAEIEKVKQGLPGNIRIKVNNLEEPYFINLLYNASKKGVKIDLIVRSICCLIPQQKDLSENITVKRIVDKYLEHPRIFIFGSDESATVAIGSSDLMTRNLRRRIEVCINVKDLDCRKQLLDYFNLQWQDDTKAVILSNTMNHIRIKNTANNNAQTDIYNYLKNVPC